MSAPISKAEWERQRREATEVIPGLVEEVGLPKVLLPYQQKTVGLLDSASTQVLFVEKSRRIGLTWGLAAYAVLRAGRQRKAGGMDVMYISYSQEMTREFIDACAMWARAFNTAAYAVDETLFDDSDAEGEKSIKAFRIGFASGFEIMALSSAPRGLRGKQGVVIIDEAAFVDALAELLKAALAFLMWGGQVVVCSTHDGVDNAFNATVQDILGGRLPYAHLRIDFDRALREGLYERICLVSGREWTAEGEAAWRQDIIDFYADGADEELFCIPSQGSGTWLAAPLIEARMTADAPVLRLDLPPDFLQRPELERRSLVRPFMEELEAALETLDLDPHFAFGFDFGRVADLSTGSLLAIERMLKRREALSFELRGVPGDEQKAIVKAILGHVRARLVGAAFDATGMGWTVAEDMGRLFGLRETEDSSGLVMAIKFSQDWYRVNMPPLKTAFEDNAIAIAPDDAHLGDLRLVKVIRGIPMLPKTREGEKGQRRHGDYAIALALAHYASRMRWSEYGYRPAVTREPEPGRMQMQRHHDDDRRRRSPMASPLGTRIRGTI
ncbi:terminase large subunit domain-containing protein [Pseudoroseicyclus sp. H15]